MNDSLIWLAIGVTALNVALPSKIGRAGLLFGGVCWILAGLIGLLK